MWKNSNILLHSRLKNEIGLDPKLELIQYKFNEVGPVKTIFLFSASYRIALFTTYFIHHHDDRLGAGGSIKSIFCRDDGDGFLAMDIKLK